MNKTLLIIFALAALLVNDSFGQFIRDDEENESETSETIRQREQYIYTRRAGGPGKVLPKNAHEKAVKEKMLLPEDNDNPNSPTSSASWFSVNPTGMFYQFTNNNYISGRTNSIVFHPTDANTFYIAAAQGGVWKTTDGGILWSVLTDNLGSISSGDIAMDPSNADILYYGTGELNYSLDSQYGDGIYKSTNAGSSWIKIVPAATVGSYISRIIVDPVNTNIVLCSGSNGIYRSTNAGSNWLLKLSNDISSLVMDPFDSQILYASTGSDASPSVVYKSTDNGLTWFQINNGIPSNVGRIQLAISPDNSNYIYASVANSGGSLNGLYRTTNAGANFSLMTSSPNYLSSQGWYDNAVTVIPGNVNGVVVGGLDVYSSTNGGTTLTKRSTWSTTSSGNFSHADIHNLSYNGSVLYCCSDGGVYKSTNNGVNWTDLNVNISTLQYQSADFDPTDITRLYGGTQDNNKQTSTNQGVTWIQRTTGDGGYTIVDYLSTNYVYGQYVNGSVQRSTNYGVSFSNFTPSGSSGGLFYNPYELQPSNPMVMVFGRANVYRTTNCRTATTSSGWTQIASTATVGGNVSAIGISYQDQNKIYIGTSNGRILVTSNGGTNWSASTGFPYVSDMWVDSLNDNTCYATFGGTGVHVYKTTNSGSSWSNISGNLPSIGVNSIAVKMTTPRTLFVGSDLGVFQSTNDGANWTSFNTGFPNVEVYDLKYRSGPKILLAATHGRGCFMFDLSSLKTLELTVAFEACLSADTIAVELRSSSSPYNLVESSNGLGGGGVTYSILFSNAVNGVPYYIVVKNRHSIETWSSGANAFSSNTLSYNFTSSSAQAFGSNLILANGLYSFYEGDIDQDGTIDVTDIAGIFNDADSFATGYVVTDLNCDNLTDVSDILIAFNNANNFINVIQP